MGEPFRCRCSALGKIMADPKGSFTAKQAEKLKELLQKKSEKMAKGEDVTEKQNETIKILKAKKLAPPELSETTKTYLKEWYIEQRFGRKKEFTNRFTEKGIVMEDHSIELLCSVTGEKFLKKNEKSYENEWITGTPDLLPESKVIDIKSSWDIFTFPLFEEQQINKYYWWQLQGYMILSHRERAMLAYCLVDTPPGLILKELNRTRWNMEGIITEEQEGVLEELIQKNMTFEDIPENLRIKTYDIPRDETAFQKIKDRVLLCREYIKTLELALNNK